MGGAVASWLVHLTLEWAVQVWTLAGNIVLCSWARRFTLTVPLSTQVYKMVPVNLLLGVNLWRTTISPRGSRILPVPSCYWNWDKLWPDEPLGLYADFIYLFYTWVERGTVRINCLSQQHNTTSLARTKPRVSYLEMSTLTMSPLLHLQKVKK